MKIMKRWFALMLTVSVALSDWGGITVFAAEDAIAVEIPDSGNKEESSQEGEGGKIIFDEMPFEPEAVSEEGTENSNDTDILPEYSDEDKTVFSEGADEDKDADGNKIDEEAASTQNDVIASETETELSALHIGQIKEGEEFPNPEDREFIYDLPVSFAGSDSVILFAHYDTEDIDIGDTDHTDNTDTALEKEESRRNEESEKDRLIWSILRGKNGLKEGSTSLVKEKDDWIGFEVVSDSPYFTMVENEEEENAYYKTVELAPKDTIEDDGYNYYIRAAYYFGAEEENNEEFYAAATIPFLPGTDTDIDGTQDDALKEEDHTNQTQDDIINTEEADIDKADIEKTQEEELPEEESDIVGTLEEADIKDADTEGILEDAIDGEASALAENDDTQQHSQENMGVLILSAEKVTLHSGDNMSVSAAIEPKDIFGDISELILWTSSDEDIAGVAGNGTNAYIYAYEEGVAQITAAYNGIEAHCQVEIVARDEDEVYDLSNDIWIAGFQKESEDLVYTGNKITQDIKVYHKETLLKEKTDYTLSYKNNINAAAYNTLKAPSVTITMKGQYSGSVTLYYTIKPANINDIDIYNLNKSSFGENGTEDNTGTDSTDNLSVYEQAVTYSTNLKLPNPELMFGKKKLAVNKDFVCDYTGLPQPYNKGDSYDAGKVYDYTVNGIGNFTGSFKMHFVVVKDKNYNFNSASVTLGQKQYEYHGTALSDSEVTISKLTLGKNTLDANLYEHKVYATGIEGAYVMVYPTAAGKAAGYYGHKKVNLKLVGDRNIKEAVTENTNWKESITFSQKAVNEEGGIFQGKTGILTFGAEKEVLVEGKDYTVKYGNAKKVGRVSVTFTGKGRYKGTLKKTYEITPNIDKNNFTIGWKNVTRKGNDLEIAYQKGGAVPDFVLKDQNNNVLKNKTDYTVKVTNNKMPGTALSCEINGKGNYKGYQASVQIMVTKGDISKGTISLSDKPYSTKPNAWKSAVTIKDANGKKLTAGIDYDKEFEYKYDTMENAQYPAAGSTVTVTVHGTGYYEGTDITGSYRIFENNISKLKITIDAQEYTGKEVTLTPGENIHAYANSTDQKKQENELKTPPCYEIIGYSNNIKAGTAKVTLRGLGDYGGTKTYSFKIKKKAYLKNSVTGITFDKTNLSFSLQDQEEEKRTLTATIKVQTLNQEISNPTVVWTSSNSQIATVEAKVINATTVAGVITGKKEGSVTITATTQDGNKKVQCKVTIVDAPVLKEAGQTIKKAVGETYQLNLDSAQTDVGASSGIVWESSNSAVVSVSSTGLLKMEKAGVAIISVYKKNKPSYVQQCYAVSIGDEQIPEGPEVLTYIQEPGTTDDTPYINKLLRDWENHPDQYEYMYLPAGVYHIDPVEGLDSSGTYYRWGGIMLTDNQKLIMSPSTLLIAIGNNKTNYQVIRVCGSTNVSISGGQIIGERNEHTGSGGEWGHGINISGSINVTVKDVEISQCWGDGIYLGFYEGIASDDNRVNIKRCSDGVTIENCNLHHNRRNNLSITDVSNVTIRNCRFDNAKGTDPQFGIDIEPNDGKPCKNIKIYDSTFTGNAKASMGIMTAASDITIENCTMSGHFYNWAGKNVVLKNTTVKGDIVDHVPGNLTIIN